MTRSPRTAARIGPAAAVAAAALAICLSACLAEPVTTQGREVSRLYGMFMLAGAGVFALVVGLMAWSIVRYRGPRGRDVPLPPSVHGNVALELTWWALPTAIVVVLVIGTVLVLNQVDARAQEPQVTVGVEGFQWGWRFTYEEDDVVVTGTAEDPPTIRLPIGETVAFEIVSNDVVHSFNIPQFLIKRDAVPGRENRFDVVIDQEGTYGGQCGEFCGLLHARQLFTIEAVTRDAFDAWIAEQTQQQGAPDGDG